MVTNAYFELTDAFNAPGRIAVLVSGQAVVYYRFAMMSKDGDWILRETGAACRRVLDVLAERGARYRAGAPLDPRWLAAGWSSHFELADDAGRRLRCDFFSRPPRVPAEVLAQLFADPEVPDAMPVIDPESLILMKHTQRAKDYPVIAELARLLPPEREIEFTTNPDRILELAPRFGQGCERPAVRAAREGRQRLAVVLALAEEADRLQQLDRLRLDRYQQASAAYLQAARKLDRAALALPGGHLNLLDLAESLLPVDVDTEPDR